MLKKRDLTFYNDIEENQKKKQKLEEEERERKRIEEEKQRQREKEEREKLLKEFNVSKKHSIYSIVVKNIPRKDTENILREKFKYDDIRLPTFKNSTELKGIAFMDFKDENNFINALKLNGKEVNGYQLLVEMSKDGAVEPKQKRDENYKSKEENKIKPQETEKKPKFQIIKKEPPKEKVEKEIPKQYTPKVIVEKTKKNESHQEEKEESNIDTKKYEPKKYEAPKHQIQKISPNSNVYSIVVRNIPRKDTELQLKEFFQSDEIRLPTFKDSNELKGLAFIDFKDESKYQRALNMNGQELGGFKLVVEKTKKKLNETQELQQEEKEHSVKYEPKKYEAPKHIIQKVSQNSTVYSIVVRNIPRKDTESQLKEFFQSDKIRLPTFKDSNELKGLAFIDFKDESKYQRALNMNGQELGGFKLVVEKTKKKLPEVQQPEKQIEQEKIEKPKEKPMENAITILVRDLPKTTKEEELRDLFKDCINIRLPTYKDTNEIKGLAFIDFPSQNQADKFLNEEIIYNGCKLSIELSKKKEVKKEMKNPEEIEEKNPIIEKQEQNDKITILDLGPKITEDDIRAHFQHCGKMKEVIRPKFEDGRPKNFAFIIFENSLGVFAATQMDKTKLRNSTIRVTQYEKKKTEKSELIDKIASNKQKIVHVGNLPFTINEQKVRDLFIECGNIKEIRIPVHNDTGKVKGFAFIEFETEEGAQNAIQWHNTLFEKRKISVQFTSFK